MSQSDINSTIDESGLISSKQCGVHPKLEHTVHKHLQTPWQGSFHKPTVEVWSRLRDTGIFSGGRAIILDSGCGTGVSTQHLAETYSRCVVLGVDRSQVRLAKSGVHEGLLVNNNCVLVRAELTTFWRLMLRDGYTLNHHFLFYPNPYPKPGHLKRRWHAHPVFPQLLALGGEIEMRCNWEIYAQEFAQAVNLACSTDVKVRQLQLESGSSPFEIKYRARGQALYAVTVAASLTIGCRRQSGCNDEYPQDCCR